jgi:murein DD-endopeptidase MepM/ murein hydrolase activator NlpD
MALPGLTSLDGLRPLPTATPEADGVDRQRIAAVAQEFEAMLLLQMVRQMRQSLLSAEPDGEGLGASTMYDTLDVELARQLSAQGGIGLASVIERSLHRGAGAPAAPGAAPEAAVVPTHPAGLPTAAPAGRGGVRAALATDAAAPGGAARLPVSAPGDPAFRIPLDAASSSAFGWRTDPFHGAKRFHAGVDLRAAYGREVPVAAPRRVVFAGERGAYGQLVIVAHADGVETRYAHLSAIAVTPGQQLASGDFVGRVGQSGRATGPHLHFEVLVNGTRVDPARFAGVPPDRAGE